MLALHLLASSPALRLAPLGAPPAVTMQVRDAVARAAARSGNAPTGNPSGVVQPTNQGQPTTVQGGSLRTFQNRSPNAKQTHVRLGTNGRPMDANVEVWEGPNNSPVTMRVYGEDGQQRPVDAMIGGPGRVNTVSARNTGPLEFPMAASVVPTAGYQPMAVPVSSSATTIQGGALRTYPFDYSVGSVQVTITSQGYPCNCRIEILQGPNTNRQGIELYTDNGRDRPISYILETPGYGSIVEITNTGPMEYPVTASVEPYSIQEEMSSAPVVGGDPWGGGPAGLGGRGSYDYRPGFGNNQGYGDTVY